MVRKGSIFVVGVLTLNSQLLTLNCANAQEWVARYNGPANFYDVAYAIAVDGQGNVYVTGRSYASFGDCDYATIKYNSSGVEQWVKRYNYSNWGDNAYAIAVDGQGNVYVTGGSWGTGTTGYDYATVKYNSSGVEQWAKRYNGPDSLDDAAYAIAIDDSGNVYVTGVSGFSAADTSSEYATIKYNSAGVEQWAVRYDGPGNNSDLAKAIAVDGSGNVYVTGESYGTATPYGSDYATIKYNSAGVEQWAKRYNGPANLGDGAYAIAVDGQGYVYITGWSGASDTFCDYATIKYNSSGVEQWAVRYDGPVNTQDVASAIAIDEQGNVYVTGGSMGTDTFYDCDYATIKYNSAGDTVWLRRYNGPSNFYDYATAIALDGSGNVYVTGESYDSSTDYTTIKYNSSGTPVWLRRYNGPGNSSDQGYAMAVDGAGNVYVTGGSFGSGTGSDYATIKYSGVGVEESCHSERQRRISLEIQPNPVIQATTIKYYLPTKANISLSIYDISGRLVNTIYSGTHTEGSYETKLTSSELASGIYFVLLETEEFKITRKLIILK